MNSIVIATTLLFGSMLNSFAQSKVNNNMSSMKEVQITFSANGHTLNATQVFSPDGEWVVYDTRNDDTKIGSTSSIEKVNLNTGEIVTIYTTRNQTQFGPGVGAAAYNPLKDEVIFIHGLENCSESKPYGFTRRFGAIVGRANPNSFVHAEARCVTTPLVAGALRGGTHAHTWSADGTRISFTYNDEIAAEQERITNGKIKDLRTIGMSIPTHEVKVSRENAEDFSGKYFSFVTATVIENPKPGSDEIDRAFDECWIGTHGYVRSNGVRQNSAIAFQGNVRGLNNEVVTEVFVSNIPEKIEASDNLPFQGTPEGRPNVPSGLTQVRLTHTNDRKFPGVQGPRCRVRSSPDGNSIYFHMKDDTFAVQIYRIKTTGGNIEQITDLKSGIQSQYNISPDGNKLSCISENRVWIIDLNTKKAMLLTEPAIEPIVGGSLWSPDGRKLVFNRYVGSGTERYLQIFAVAAPR